MLVLNSEKTFRSIVNFVVIDFAADKVPVLLFVRFKADSAMEKDFQIGPELGNILVAGFGQNKKYIS